MKYELIPNTSKGILVDRTSIMQDIRDTYEVSFLLPDDGAYIVLFKAADGAEYRKVIKDGVCKIPKELLAKEQYVEVTVCNVDNDKILHSWDCEPLKITAFLNMRRTQWQVSGGMSDNDCYARLSEVERLYAQAISDFASLKEEVLSMKNNYSARLDYFEKKYDEVINGVDIFKKE